jgi:prephenate dehydrogenase
MTLRLAIVGLNQVGASLGLALSRYPETLTCVGYDEEPGLNQSAYRMGAISKGFLALQDCVKDTKIIILACPLDEIKKNLSIIAQFAPKGTTVIDCSPNKRQVADWASEILPPGIYFTGWTLAVNPAYLHDAATGIDAARADMFANSYVGITDPPGTPEAVLTLNSDLVALLDAKSFFIDALEADGLMAMGHELPQVVALALLLATVDSPGWFEARKLASAGYAKATLPILSVGEREQLGSGMLLNRDNLTRLIDDLIGSLMRVRSHLDEDNAQDLQKDLEHAIHQRLLWLEQRRLMNWGTPGKDDQLRVERPSLLGSWLQSKLKKDKGS